MTELLKGRISDTEGLKEVLEIVATFKEVSTAVLDVDSADLSGRIGVAWGKYITGALITASGEKGKRALRKLLRLREGKFSFVDLETEPPIVELRQQLGIDLVRTATVVPGLEYKEAHFLWDMSEDHEADDYAPLEITGEDESVDQFELEEEISKPSEPDLSQATHDVSPVLPVAQAKMDQELAVPEAGGAQPVPRKPVGREPQGSESGSTPALDAVFGASFNEPPPPQTGRRPSGGEAWRHPSEERAPAAAAQTSEVVAEPMQPEAAKAAEKTDAEPEEEEDVPKRAPKPIFMSRFVGLEAGAAKITAPEPFEALPKPGPMLASNTVASTDFLGQQFVESPPARIRPEQPTTNSVSIGVAVFCVVLFVVSCAGTVIFGPRAWEMLASVLHI